MPQNAIFRELSQGKTLYNGKYIIERVLGMGGFGITYYARHATLHNYCAIKEFFINGSCVRNTQTSEIHLQGITEGQYGHFKHEFIKEGQTLAEFDHPNIVKVIDIFDENNTSYIVMPFIEGITLQQLVDNKGKLDYEMAVNYIGQISDAIGYIHERNILHRDIAPDNVIITPKNRIVLIDFGSAREFVHDKTQHHTTILKKGYAPLEQYSANSRKGSYSDIYALGAVFYFALTGQKPMDATERTMENMPEPKTLSASVPEDANRTIMKAMSLKPENRHQNINEFMNDLLGRGKPENKKKKSKFIWVGVVLLLIFVALLMYYLSGNTNKLPEKNTILSTEKSEENIGSIPEEHQNENNQVSQNNQISENNQTKETIRNTEWISQYEKALSEADKLFSQKSYESAKRKYLDILKIIPAIDGNNKRSVINNKIAECNRNIKTDEELKQKTAEEAQRKAEEELKQKAENEEKQKADEVLKQKIENEANQKAAENEKKRIEQELVKTLVDANDAFNVAQYEKAFSLYKKVKELNPNDNTGCNNFINKAKQMIPRTGYDSFVKNLLLKAKELDPANNEVSRLLSNYK
ncbi:MAG: protein kinase [Candidatus Azobacteroides sp.]|nr:protein kinase [Candidatus Azobacteroides sp.]